MPKSEEKKKSKKEKRKEKKLQELLQKQEEDKQKQREEFFKQEQQERNNLYLYERFEISELKLEKNKQYAQFMVEKRAHIQLQTRFTELSRAAQSDKALLEKNIGSLTRTKEMLETELSELRVQYKTQAEELAHERKRLEAEMSEKGNCFVCADCSKSIYKIIRKQSLAAQLLRREGLV
eukprot:TRINITY_DN54312_c0_g1_i1.p2 TRINITY_DN54312_c0_g1~~TRINITY_DN54312_c0_g1_i1.p2  ORF type:complete len:179 (+),score=30.53 TRINITY_DN54312_c0_g1_i1:61-597(+)